MTSLAMVPSAPPFYTAYERACAFVRVRAVNEILQFDFSIEKSNWIRRKCFISLNYEVNFRYDSCLSDDDIGFYEKNGVEKNAMP
jgi:hypothetical protein